MGFLLDFTDRDKRRLTTKYFPRLFLGISKNTYLKVEKMEILKDVFIQYYESSRRYAKNE